MLINPRVTTNMQKSIQCYNFKPNIKKLTEKQPGAFIK